ncbi:MAG: IS21 family transposase [Desulfocucumaceae bacterium]
MLKRCNLAFIRELAREIDFNATRIFEETKAKGYAGSYSTLKNIVRPLRDFTATGISKSLVRNSPGRQDQMDWRIVGDIINSNKYVSIVFIIVIVLGYSRVLHAENKRLPILISCHKNAFDWFGGLPEKILAMTRKPSF